MQPVEDVDREDHGEHGPEELLSDQPGARLGEGQGQLDDGEGQPLGLDPAPAEDGIQTKGGAVEQGQEERPHPRRHDPRPQNVAPVEGGAALPHHRHGGLGEPSPQERRHRAIHGEPSWHVVEEEPGPLVLRPGVLVAVGHDGHEHLEHVVAHHGRGEAQHGVDHQKLAMAEGDAWRETTDDGVDERDGHKYGDHVVEEGDGGREARVPHGLRHGDPVRVRGHQNRGDDERPEGHPTHCGTDLWFRARSGRG